MTPADIGRLRQVGAPRLSPGGGTGGFTVPAPDMTANRYRRQICLSPADPANGQPRPFTGQGAEHMPRWSPDGRRLAFVSSVPGEGRSPLCILPVGGGGERLVVCSVDTDISD